MAETPLPQSFTKARPPQAISMPERHSVYEIKFGVEAVMARLTGGRVVDQNLATLIAAKIQPAVNNPASPLDSLAGNPAFESMVIAVAPSLAQSMSDPAAQLAAARREVELYNPSAGPLSGSALAALGWTGMGHGRGDGVANAGGVSTNASSARYDGMSSSTANSYWTTEAGMNETRSYAAAHGLSWATGNPDLMRLGRPALETFAKVNMRQETYDKLTKKIGFRPAEAAEDTKYYLDHGGDPKKHQQHVDKLDRNLDQISGHDPVLRKQTLDAILKFERSDGGQEAKKRFEDSLSGIAGNDEKRQQGAKALKDQYVKLADQKAGAKQNADNQATHDQAVNANFDSVFGATPSAAPQPAANAAPQPSATVAGPKSPGSGDTPKSPAPSASPKAAAPSAERPAAEPKGKSGAGAAPAPH